jgi:hypothetical protein
MFYSSLHQKNADAVTASESETNSADFTGTAWNLVHSGAINPLTGK